MCLMLWLAGCAAGGGSTVQRSVAEPNAKGNSLSAILQRGWQAWAAGRTQSAVDKAATVKNQNSNNIWTLGELGLLEATLLSERRPQAAALRLKQTLALLQSKSETERYPRQKILNTEILVHTRTGDLARVVTTWLTAMQWLPELAKAQAEEAIWAAVQKIDPRRLQRLAEQADTQEKRAWYELALVKHGGLSVGHQYQSYLAWQSRWPEHSAAQQPPPNLQLLPTLIRRQPSKVAVLLPTSGPLQAAGKAIRDGILAVHFQNIPADRTIFLFFDTDAMSIKQAYSLAVREGVDLVVGPLEKSLLPPLLDIAARRTPILALNYLPGQGASTTSPTLYQFGLPQNTEITQLVEWAWAETGPRSIIIHADNPRGNDDADLVLASWQQLGGEVIQRIAITKPREVVSEIAKAIGAKASTARGKRLQKLLDQPIKFGARTRQDIDLILLIADAEIASLIQPALAYYFASDLPVYAMSNAIPRDSATVAYPDLTGIRYCDLPWQIYRYNLKATLEAMASKALGTTDHLYALGVDVAGLISRLAQFKQNERLMLNGAVGYLSLDKSLRFRRDLVRTEMIDGRSVPLMPPIDPSKMPW